MKNISRFCALALFALVSFASVADAQLAQSGGGGSSLTSITLGGNSVTALATGELNTNLARVGGSAVSTGNGVAGVGVQRVAIASDNTAFSVNATLQTGSNSIGNVGLNAGTNFIGMVAPKTTCGTTPVDSGFVSVPSASTVVTNMSAATCAEKILVSNVTASPVTFNLTDNAGTPNGYITSFSIPANSNLVFDLAGMKFSAGIKWSAGSASALVGQIVGWQ
jgi:hypothetical protein